MKFKLFFLVPALVFAEPSILQSGPSKESSIPLTPVQFVDSWKGHYQSQWGDIWVFATRSVFFQLQGASLPSGKGDIFLSQGMDEQQRLFKAYTLRSPKNPSWGWAFFFPQSKEEGLCLLWITSFLKDFFKLDNLPRKGQAVVFPSILVNPVDPSKKF